MNTEQGTRPISSSLNESSEPCVDTLNTTEGVLPDGKRPFFYDLRKDLRIVWHYKMIAIKPLIYTIISVIILEWLKHNLPVLFIDFGKEYDKFSMTVFVALLVIYGFLGNSTLEKVQAEDEALEDALSTEDLLMFCKYFYRRIAPPIKVMLFSLSVCMVYCVTIFHYERIEQSCLADGIILFLLYLGWMIASEFDDPFSGSWNIKPRVPVEWWMKVRHSIVVHGSIEKGRIYIKDNAVLVHRELLAEKEHPTTVGS